MDKALAARIAEITARIAEVVNPAYAEAFRHHAEPFGYYLDLYRPDEDEPAEDTVRYYYDAYLGQFASFEDFARTEAGNRGFIDPAGFDEWPLSTIDWTAAAREIGNNYAVRPASGGGVHVFDLPLGYER